MLLTTILAAAVAAADFLLHHRLAVGAVAQPAAPAAAAAPESAPQFPSFDQVVQGLEKVVSTTDAAAPSGAPSRVSGTPMWLLRFAPVWCTSPSGASDGFPNAGRNR